MSDTMESEQVKKSCFWKVLVAVLISAVVFTTLGFLILPMLVRSRIKDVQENRLDRVEQRGMDRSLPRER